MPALPRGRRKAVVVPIGLGAHGPSGREAVQAGGCEGAISDSVLWHDSMAHEVARLAAVSEPPSVGRQVARGAEHGARE